MSDDRGYYDKFTVTRNDGRDRPGEKHHGCSYFVLDLTHDPAAHDALKAYADACEKRRPNLAFAIREMLSTPPGSVYEASLGEKNGQ